MDKWGAVPVGLAVAVAAAAALMMMSGGGAEAAMQCETVANDLSPCISFVMNGNGGGAPPAGCCEGVRSLYRQASSTADRQAVCSCLKSVAASATQAMIANAAALPGKCGVSIPYKISPNTDCSTVH
ncbi:non-specific lipid-transfer protein 1-like [Andrographis paniculata]|uniref:non-specific lipid-transfer protein 1-like n=1 Tax=Andrographis paniculata TaxID=175694 RepID=UPI0021E84CB8|nr:non-specific lipid-transfer protein 1-like [Andrographis paniculata]